MWDVTVATALADSYTFRHLHHQLARRSRDGGVQETSQVRHVVRSHVFQPIAMETLGPINETDVQFLNDLGHSSVSVDDKDGEFLFQRLYRSAEIQRHLAARVVWE